MKQKQVENRVFEWKFDYLEVGLLWAATAGAATDPQCVASGVDLDIEVLRRITQLQFRIIKPRFRNQTEIWSEKQRKTNYFIAGNEFETYPAAKGSYVPPTGKLTTTSEDASMRRCLDLSLDISSFKLTPLAGIDLSNVRVVGKAIAAAKVNATTATTSSAPEINAIALYAEKN